MGDLCFGEFRLDPADERLWGSSGPIKLGNKAFRVLLKLVEQHGCLITKDELFSTVWDGTFVSESALTSVIKELRRALGDESRTPIYIQSVYGRGYRFVAPVEVEPSRPARALEAQPTAESALGDPPILYVPRADDAAVRDLHPFLAETLREEILCALARFRDIRLISELAPPGAPAPDYGKRDYRLSLRLLAIGERVQAFARLTSCSSGGIIWAETTEFEPEDLGRAAESFVARIAAAALPTLHDDILRTVEQQAHDGYSQYFRNKLQMRCQDSLEGARGLAESWEQLIAQHPTLTAAYPPLLRLYNTDFCFTGFGASGDTERARAYELAHRAVGYEPTEAHLHTAKAWCHLWAAEAQLARRHLDEAVRLNPYNQTRLLEAATGYLFLDDLDKAESLLERSRNLSSFTTDSPHEEQALLHLLREEYDAAAAELAFVCRCHPDDGMRSQTPVLTELYGLLAASGSRAADLEARSEAWQQRMRSRWAAAEPPDPQRLVRWALDHNPFQSAERKDRLVTLLSRALQTASPGRPRTPAREHRGTRYAPEPVPAVETGVPIARH